GEPRKRPRCLGSRRGGADHRWLGTLATGGRWAAVEADRLGADASRRRALRHPQGPRANAIGPGAACGQAEGPYRLALVTIRPTPWPAHPRGTRPRWCRRVASGRPAGRAANTAGRRHGDVADEDVMYGVSSSTSRAGTYATGISSSDATSLET